MQKSGKIQQTSAENIVYSNFKECDTTNKLDLSNQPNISVGQRVFWHPDGAFAIEISLQNTDLKRLPIYQNAVTSLAVNDDIIIGGTSAKEGLSPFLFVASISEKKLVEFENLNEIIDDQRSINAGFCKLDSNQLITGSIPNRDSNQGGHLIQLEVNREYEIVLKIWGFQFLAREYLHWFVAKKEISFMV